MEECNNRLICYLDVLGYSALIDNHGTQYVYDSYSKFIDEAKNKAFYGKSIIKDKEKDVFVISEIVSDSMLFVSNEISDVFSINNFVGAIHTILELGLENNFLFRGAITLGDMIYDKERSIFLSKEYNKLAKFEPTIELPICVIFDEAKNIITDSMYGQTLMQEGIIPRGDLPIIKYNIPLKEYKHTTEDNYTKEYKCEEMWCLNYTFFSSKETLLKVQNFLSGDENKQTNFVKYIEFIKQIPYPLVILEEKFFPFKYLQIMKSRSGMRVAFLDDKMSVIHAGEHQAFPIDFIAPPSEIIIGYDFNTKQFSFQAKGR